MYILKNKLFFSILYFSLLSFDIFGKLNFDIVPFRLITKPLVIISLFFFYLINNKETSRKRHLFMIVALLFFLVGDMFLIFDEYSLFFSFGLFSFVLGKLFYAFRFSNQNDFKLIRLIPILSFCFLYMFTLLSMVYDNLGMYFFPVLIYLFTTMIVVQFVYLRKSEVDYKSYLIVGIGIIFSMFADSIAVLKTFYLDGFFYEEISIMLFYGISQYLIVYGIITEKLSPVNPIMNIYDVNVEKSSINFEILNPRIDIKTGEVKFELDEN